MAQRPKRVFPATQRLKSSPAPVGGINARDNIAMMPQTDAVSLVNWVPDSFGIRCRKGFRAWATGFPGGRAVASVFGYTRQDTGFPSGSLLNVPTSVPGALFAATDAGIYTVTNSTNSPTLAIALSGTANAGWLSTTQLTNQAGSFLLACSETDGYHTFDGTSWLKRVAGAGAGQINGVDPATFVQVCTFKRRAWFVQRDSTSAWYLAADAIAGTAAQFDFGPVLKRGGHLSYLANWTLDAGEGIDDFLVAVGSNGDVAIYKGTDPASASTFSLVGTWFVGQIPVGRRAAVQYGGDLVIISAEGVFPISMITRGGTQLLTASGQEYSSKIRSLIGADLRSSFNLRGWQALIHPNERLMRVSVPDYGTVSKRQYAMSTVGNAWAYLQDIPIYCMGSHAGYSFAGTRDGRVLLLFTGAFDDVPLGSSVGQGINGVIIPAYQYFDSPAQNCHFLMVRANFLATEPPSILVGMGVNFNTNPIGGTPVTIPSALSRWDSAVWNSSTWVGEMVAYGPWVSVGAIGFSGTAAMTTVCLGDTTLTSIDYMYAIGGPL